MATAEFSKFAGILSANSSLMAVLCPEYPQFSPPLSTMISQGQNFYAQ